MIGALSVLRWAWPYLLVASISAGAAWWLQATSYGAKIDRMERNWAEQMRDQADAARAEQSRLIDVYNQQREALANSDAAWTETVRKLRDENAQLYARKPIRVRVRNECPAPATGDGAQGGTSARVDNGTTTAELAPEVQAAIPDIDRDIGRVITQLGACQDQLRLRQ